MACLGLCTPIAQVKTHVGQTAMSTDHEEHVDAAALAGAADTVEETAPAAEEATPAALVKFEDFDIDVRLLRALRNNGFTKTTSVQAQAIPEALKGSDLLVTAKTGSGKTLAYVLPLVHKIFVAAAAGKTAVETAAGGAPGIVASTGGSPAQTKIAAMVVVPTKELADQVTRQIVQLSTYCRNVVIPTNVANCDTKTSSLYTYLSDCPNVIVGTPSKILAFLESGAVELNEDVFDTLVLDEADLIFSYGYDAETRKLLEYMPTMCQKILMSATLSDDVETLSKIALREPVVLDVKNTTSNDSILDQYFSRCKRNDKLLLLYFTLKLKIHPFGSGRTLIFVNSIDMCYKVKMFLELFGVKSCTLNSGTPVQSRFHVVQQFNKGTYDIIIATDEEVLFSTKDDSKTKQRKRKEEGYEDSSDYSVVRGIDFQNVRCVINFDLPFTTTNYVHRVGRTARGVGRRGYSLTLVANDEDITQGIVQSRCKKAGFPIRTEEEVFDSIIASQKEKNNKINEFSFDMSQVDGFRYRVDDAARTLTPAHVKEARLRALKIEIVNSEKLKTHFEENPADLQALRHDKPSRILKAHKHMKNIPDYLQPNKSKIVSGGRIKYVPFRMNKDDSKKKFGRGRGRNVKKAGAKRSDPLKFKRK